jgi:transcription antitermination factor NusG
MSNRYAENWHVLYTMPNLERKVADQLFKHGFNVFLPQYKILRQWSDRKKSLQVPLFPSYLFVKNYLHDKYKILSIPGVVKFLSTEGRLDTVSQDEIELIKNILCHNPEVSTQGLLCGDLVRIIKGPFNGMHAVLENIQGRCRVSLMIESVNKVVLIDISAACVEKVRDATPKVSNLVTS